MTLSSFLSWLKRPFIFIPALILVVAGLWLLFRSTESHGADISVRVKRAAFQVAVNVSGELQAKTSIDIHGPEGARAQGIWQLKIEKLIPEGSVVKAGDWVADLDRTEIASKIKEAELAVQKADAQYTQTSLDTNLTLSGSRDDITNLRSSLEETKLQLDQSAYEPPAIKRHTELEYQSAQRHLQQSIDNYKTKLKQAVARMSQASADLQKEKQQFEALTTLFAQLSVNAPANGMVIYAREWNGRKKTVGSQISAWEPTVATLPDLSQMLSVCYVNEVDIQKVKKGQAVEIGLDADPNKHLRGTVEEVANIGEQRPNSDSKVFEVRIQIEKSDSTLRPAMTTSNRIVVSEIANTLSLPLECLHSENGKTYVYTRRSGKLVKQEVKIGAMNENEGQILAGLNENEDVFLSTPSGATTASVQALP